MSHQSGTAQKEQHGFVIEYLDQPNPGLTEDLSWQEWDGFVWYFSETALKSLKLLQEENPDAWFRVRQLY